MRFTRNCHRCIYIFAVLNSIGLFIMFMKTHGWSTGSPRVIRQETVKRTSVFSTTKAPPAVQASSDSDLDCPGLSFPKQPDVVDYWQNVSSGRDYYVYSAYLEGKTIRIIGISNRAAKDMLYCQQWSRDSAGRLHMRTSAVRQSNIPESHEKRFTATYYVCAVHEGIKPFAVSVTSSERCAPSSNMLLMSRPPKTNVDFAVCVTPLNFRYGRAYELIEWIELHRLLGADRIFFYNHSIAANVQKALEYYSSLGVVEVLPWSIPVYVDQWPPSKTAPDIHYFGQLASHNDCLYRNRNSTKYLVYADLDEFIIPRRENVTLWKTMMSELPVSNVYMFRNVFFRKEWGDSTNVSRIAKIYKLVTLSKLKRERKIFPGLQRSKLVVVPGNVETVGIHNTWEMTGNSHVVTPEIGLLHHYRNWEQPDDGTMRVPDATMLKYKSDLIENVENTWNTLKDVEMDIPIV